MNITFFWGALFILCTRKGLLASLGVCDIDEVSTEAAHYQIDPRRHFAHVQGLFKQENASASLDRPGQHPNFGALISWDEIRQKIEPDRKLVFLIRHGEGMHNVIQAYVGETEWVKVTEKCSWRNESDGEVHQLFDPPLTENGVAQAEALHAFLVNGDTKLKDLTGGLPFSTIVSPLTRTLQTYAAILQPWVPADEIIVDEYCRERYGHNTCDARSPVELEESSKIDEDSSEEQMSHKISCEAEKGLTDLFPNVQFHIRNEELKLGLISNRDSWWRDDSRETDEHIVARADIFLQRLFHTVKDRIVFVVTHSGFLSSVLEAVGREPYSATNAELVPVLIQQRKASSYIEF